MKSLPLQTGAYRYIKQSFGEWLDILGYAQPTVYQLPHYLHEFLHYQENRGKTQLNDFTHQDFQTYFHYLQQRPNQRGGALSLNALHKHQQALHKFADYLRQSGRLVLAGLELARIEKAQPQIQVLSGAEIQALFQATREVPERPKLLPLCSRDRAMLTVYYGCGLRRSEGLKLDVEDLDFNRRLLRVRKGKGGKDRLVPFTKASCDHLQEYLYDWRPYLVKNNHQSAFFLSQRARRMDGQSQLLRLKKLVKQTQNTKLAAKQPTLHTLRHSIATHLLQAGMELDNIREFLGHDSLESTQIYTHLIEEKDGKL